MILYRFRPFNQHTITELLTQKLHFSHPSTWNDPFDRCQPSQLIYCCFAQNKSDDEKDMLQNILMWSHYAESHKGICIEYERDDSGWNEDTIQELQKRVQNEPKFNHYHFSNNFKMISTIKLSKNVAYIDKNDPDAKNFITHFNNAQSLLNGMPYDKKYKCWEYENEYRMVRPVVSSLIGREFVSYTEIGLKIKAIYCGLQFEDCETLKIIRGNRDFEIYSGTVENYASIKFTKTTT